jgi:hypothetical protein
LTALTKAESIGYIDHRLEVAGSQGRRIFAEEAYPIIYKYTGGVPRLINTLCDTCLMAAFAVNQDFVSVDTLDAAIRELQWTEHRPSARPVPGPVVVTGTVHTGVGGVQPGGRAAAAVEGNARAVSGTDAADGSVPSAPPHTEPSALPDSHDAQVVGRLLLACEGKTVMERELRPGRLVIGRTPDNDIQIDSKFISRHHCQILTQPDACVIEDLNSTNGIYVKSKRVRRHNLNDGDVVQVGQHEVMYIDERASRFKVSGEHIETEVIDQAES